MVESVNGQRRKVIAFDSWMQYAQHFERLIDAFAEKDLELLLIHVGSWGHDMGRPKEEKLGRLLIRDISYYHRMTFKEILEKEQPSAVLFLSLTPFAHRAFNRYCKRLGIPTLHLYHGIVRVQDTTLERVCPMNVRNHILRACSRVGKNIWCIWPAYIRALWETRAPVVDWWWFPYVVWRQILGTQYAGVAAPDASTTACCVYTPVDIDHVVDRYRLPKTSVYAVGNPDLLRFGITEDDLGSLLSPDAAPSNEVMYIDTAFIDIGLVFSGPDDYAAHLVRTRDSLAQQGFKLTVKLHPAHFRTGMSQLLQEKKIATCDNDQFITRLKTCCACIAEPSSLAVIPALLGMPLFLATYDKLADQVYGEVLTSYPRVQHLPDIAHFETLYRAQRSASNEKSLAAWIDRNAGPLPAEEIPQRIATIVASCVSTPVTAS